jgi:hypothetical protein
VRDPQIIAPPEIFVLIFKIENSSGDVFRRSGLNPVSLDPAVLVGSVDTQHTAAFQLFDRCRQQPLDFTKSLVNDVRTICGYSKLNAGGSFGT